MGWIKNSQGEPSASLTMSLVAFIAVTSWLVAWLVATPFGAPVPTFDAATAMAYLSPILALYFGRRWTSSNGRVAAEGIGEMHQNSDSDEQKDSQDK